MRVRVIVTSPLAKQLLGAPAAPPAKPVPTILYPPRHKKRDLLDFQVFLVPTAITAVLWVTSSNEISIVQGFAAYFILLVAWASYHRWKKDGQGLPLFSAMAAAYWLFFGFQLFVGDRTSPEWMGRGRALSGEAITQTMLLVAMGVCFLWFGYRCGLGRRVAPKRLPDIRLSGANLHYIQGLALVALFLSRLGNLALAGAGSQQIFAILVTTVYLAIIVILLWRVMEGKATPWERVFLWGFLGVRMILGLAGGWVGAILSVASTCALVYIYRYRKLPILAIACMLPYILFFQVGKDQFRKTFWAEGNQAGVLEKVEFWVDVSWEKWSNAIRGVGTESIRDLTLPSLSRTSLLTQAANVMEKTPKVVPYQYGHMYSYLLVSWIPRALWPEKPSFNEANQFYQVAYGVTRAQDLNTVSIAVGVLVEGFINFGWFGTALVMFFVGALLNFWNTTFLLDTRNLLAIGIGIALVPQLFIIEFQMAQYLSGLIQNVTLTLLLFLPIIRWQKKHKVGGRQVGRGFQLAGVPSKPL